MTIAGGGMGLFTVVLVILATGWITGPGLWPLLATVGFFSAAGSLNYTIVSQHFPRDLAGRANTAHNVLVFITAFSVVAFAQFLALIWFLREWWLQMNATLTSAAEPAHHSHRGEFEAPIAGSPAQSAREENR